MQLKNEKKLFLTLQIDHRRRNLSRVFAMEIVPAFSYLSLRLIFIVFYFYFDSCSSKLTTLI